MQEKLPCRRYCTHNYGVQRSIEMPRNISINVMSVRGLANTTEGT
jgi:hypothetical protein